MSAGEAATLADLHTVLAVSRALGAERDLDRLLAKIVAAASSLVDAERSTLFVLDRERGQLWSRVAEGSGEIRVPLGRGIAGAVAASGQPINIPDAYADARFDASQDRRSGFRTRSILCVPLTDHEQAVVGVLQALNKRSGQAFSAHDQEVLLALAAQAGVALVNAQLVQHERERVRLLRELELARTIQRALLPAQLPAVPGWRFAAWAESCEAVGGDYYDAWTRADGAFDIVIGDVSGHGLPAALLMSSARAALRALRLASDELPALAQALNRLLAEDMADDAFMTMVLSRCQPDGSIEYVSAGHEPPLVWRAARGDWDALSSTGLPLALLDDARCELARIPPLEPGDVALWYTDGVHEAPGPAGELFGIERLRLVLAEAARRGAGEPQALLAGIVDAVRHWRGGQPPHDDMSLLVAVRE
ncbi:MAG: SpoIIE family protein phosphatase [Planctomycetota bacterium]|nr:SpoIIE family protein phosphatase [Planctomycetota bacterium]